jgi:hypothetical protein
MAVSITASLPGYHTTARLLRTGQAPVLFGAAVLRWWAAVPGSDEPQCEVEERWDESAADEKQHESQKNDRDHVSPDHGQARYMAATQLLTISK